MTVVREATVAGLFYPGNGRELSTAIGGLLGALLIATKRRGMKVTTPDIRNSGDTAGDKSHVVGYGAWIFLEDNES